MQFNRTSFSTIMLTATLSLLGHAGIAKEGMWQPTKLKRQESDMQQLGLRIPVEKLYNTDGTGLNNAVVLFGSGCTGELISAKGLLFTNHHCAYSTAQSLSTGTNNFLANGFWAMNTNQELPCPGLTVKIVTKTEDVSDYVLRNLPDTLDETIREKRIVQRIEELKTAYRKNSGLEADIKPYYNGNQYWANLMETYTDVRLVAFPPNGIGKFGADTDNWMWPRMTGDFAVFRVYANSENKPAAFSSGNVPYRPKVFFPINISGVQEGDFTMVYGFPFQTRQYLSSFQVSQTKDIVDPIRIKARDKKLAIWNQSMRSSDQLFLKYAAKQSSLSNGWKKWKGEIQGLEANDVIGLKEAYEKSFQYAAVGNTDYPGDKDLLSKIQVTVLSSNNAIKANEYINETVLGVEAIKQAGQLEKVLDLYRKKLSPVALTDSLAKIKRAQAAFYKNYDAGTDQRVFDTLIPFYMAQSNEVVAPAMKQLKYYAGNNYTSWSNSLFKNSITVSEAKMTHLLDAADPADSTAIKADPAYQIYAAIQAFRKEKVTPALEQYLEHIKPLDRMYMKRQMEYLNSGRAFYPDANQTLRLSYGKIESLRLPNSDLYKTTLDQLIPRHDAQIEEFNIPEGLRNLFLSKNYGRWAVNGSVPVNFLASNHTSGGNSGSPVLNGNGELIGINFDRVWQGTMSDLFYDPKVCRNISVDIRYVLFIIEKYGHAGWLLDEMKLVK